MNKTSNTINKLLSIIEAELYTLQTITTKHAQFEDDNWYKYLTKQSDIIYSILNSIDDYKRLKAVN